METLHIVVYRMRDGEKWEPQINGTFSGHDAERLARNFAECLSANDGHRIYRVVCGTVSVPESEAEIEVRLGKF